MSTTTDKLSILARPAALRTSICLAIIGLIATIYFTAIQYGAGGTAFAVGVVFGHTIIVLLLLVLALRKRPGDLWAAIAIMYVAYGAYEARNYYAVRSFADHYKTAVTFMMAKAQAGQMIESADLDALNLGSDRANIGVMATWINETSSSVLKAQKTFEALPFPEIYKAAWATPEKRGEYLADVAIAKAANDAIVPTLTAALTTFRNSFDGGVQPESQTALNSAIQSGQATINGLTKLADARRAVLVDTWEWLVLFETVRFQVDEKDITFATQEDLDRYRALRVKFGADVQVAQDAFLAIQQQNGKTAMDLRELQKTQL